LADEPGPKNPTRGTFFCCCAEAEEQNAKSKAQIARNNEVA
jgi:hypothetical protein